MRVVATGLGVAMLGLAGAAATLRTGRKVRREVDPVLDDPLAPPTDGTHHELDTHDGGLLHAVEFPGEGRPIVLLHGVTLQWWVWASTIALLRGRHRTVVWDMRGHGRSRAGSEGVTLEASPGAPTRGLRAASARRADAGLPAADAVDDDATKGAVEDHPSVDVPDDLSSMPPEPPAAGDGDRDTK